MNIYTAKIINKTLNYLKYFLLDLGVIALACCFFLPLSSYWYSFISSTSLNEISIVVLCATCSIIIIKQTPCASFLTKNPFKL